MLNRNSPLGLGSASPRRRELLEALGIPLRILPAPADERVVDGEGPDAYLERVVALKLDAVCRLHASQAVGAWLVADTVVIVDGAVLGKPTDVEDAKRMLKRLSGRPHEVGTRFAVGQSGDGKVRLLDAETVLSRVWFRALDAAEIEGYAASREGLDKAGAYAIQGLGSFAVARIEGSYSNIVGLPVCEVVVALKRAGLLPKFP